jgi:galactose-1-phosphate uridylyltransferase
MDNARYYIRMKDETVKQLNPFTGTEVWSVPDRSKKALTEMSVPRIGEPLQRHEPEDYCSFCRARYLDTAPEKSRVVVRDGVFDTQHELLPSQAQAQSARFRRVSNLFEIVSIDYWRRNYEYKLSPKNQRWKERYLSDPEGLTHVNDILNWKLRRSGKSDEEISAIDPEQKLRMSEGLFGGGHELIIVEPHYRVDAADTTDLFSTSDMSDEEHFAYFRFIIDSMRDISVNNRYVRYISVYKNWLRQAGASYDHLHMQLVAIDEWGTTIKRQIQMVTENRNVFNECGTNLAGRLNLIFAENDHALAYVGIGHRHPTIEIYSKSVNARPHEHTEAEIRGMSDLVRACHAAVGPAMSVNEEWYYTPFDSIFKMPWHVNIKLRINVPAGFEGGTKIYINPLTPYDLRDKVVPALYRLRGEQRCASSIRIAEECGVEPNVLLYGTK